MISFYYTTLLSSFDGAFRLLHNYKVNITGTSELSEDNKDVGTHTTCDGDRPVSYTHLDVYKRQTTYSQD